MNPDYFKNYYMTNKDWINKRSKMYYENNRTVILAAMKKYRDENPDISRERKQKYYEEHKEEIKKKKAMKWLCACGSEYQYSDQARHRKTKKHIAFCQNAGGSIKEPLLLDIPKPIM